jgi:hypothetical protein
MKTFNVSIEALDIDSLICELQIASDEAIEKKALIDALDVDESLTLGDDVILSRIE